MSGDSVIVRSLDDIPAFKDEDEEFAYWATHSLGDDILEQAGPLPDDVLPRPRTRPVSVRLDEDTLARLKRLAREKSKGYQTLLKEFITERLYEEEKRHGLVGETRNAVGAPTGSAAD